MEIHTLYISNRKLMVREDGLIIHPAFVSKNGSKIRERHTWGALVSKGRYLQTCVKVGKVMHHLSVHRLVAEAFLPTWNASLQVDHINGNKTDNNVKNLRMVTSQQNKIASRIVYGSVPFRGVSKRRHKKNPFEANIMTHGKPRYLGLFPTAEKAAKAWDRAAIELGFFAEALNFPQSANTNHQQLELL